MTIRPLASSVRMPEIARACRAAKAADPAIVVVKNDV
jgi:hypothetical protein